MTTPNKLCEQCSLPLPLQQGRRTMHVECQALSVNLPRRCKKCRKVKAASNFSRDSSRAEGRYPYCTPCASASLSKFQNPDDELNGHVCPMDDVPVRGHRNRRFCSLPCKARVTALRKNYGLDVKDYRRLIADADGRCPICDRRPTSWQVDHNHRTGLTTGVVCTMCNVGSLAYSGHDVEAVRRLLAYLTETPADRLGIVAIAPEGSEKPSNLHKGWERNRYQARGPVGRNQYSPQGLDNRGLNPR